MFRSVDTTDVATAYAAVEGGGRGVALTALAVFVLGGFSVGCSPDSVGSSEESDTGWNVGDDGVSKDTSTRDTGPDGDVEPPPSAQEVTFRLVNDTDHVVRYQNTERCRTDAWLDYQTPNMVGSTSSCDVCRCSSVEEQGTCADCAADGRCAPPSSAELEPGDTLTTSWSGYVWEEESVDGTSCKRRAVPEEDTTFEVRMCWGGTSDGTGVLSNQECETRSFQYGSTSEVEHVIEGETREAQETTFRLTNRTGRELEIYNVSRCTDRTSRWVALDDFNRDTYFPKVIDSCTTCDCETIENGDGCGVCGGACAKPTPTSFVDGETVTWKWNGHLYEDDEVDGQSCARDEIPSPGREFQVRFCWIDPRTGASDVTDCQTKTMQYGESPIEHVVEPGF